MGKHKRRKDGSKLNRGPFDYKEIRAALKRGGLVWEPGGKHGCMVNHETGAKVPLSTTWTGVKVGQHVFRTVARTSGLGEERLLLLLLNGREID
jgi:hypothetical protein